MTIVANEKVPLRDVRIDAGLDSQKALAQAAGITKSTVWLAENGRTISYTSARKIVNALKTRGAQVAIADIAWEIKK